MERVTIEAVRISCGITGYDLQHRWKGRDEREVPGTLHQTEWVPVKVQKYAT